MKIAVCLSSLPLSGVGTSVGIIHDGLKSAGHQVDVLITGHFPGGDLDYAKASGWNVIFTAANERFLRRRLERLIECIGHGGYDVVLNNTSIETQLVLPCVPERVCRISVMRSLNRDALKHVAINSVHTHAVVAISQEMARVLSQDPRVRAPVRLIPNCTRAVGGVFPKLNGQLELCYLGRLSHPDRNVLILPEIARSLKLKGVSFRLRIAGDGPAKRQLTRRVAQLRMSEVELLGSVARNQGLELLAASHFALLPSVYEGLSNVLLECMATGCVPVCSDIENFKWVLGEVAPAVQCRLHDADDYARRLLALRAQGDDYRNLQRYLRTRQQEQFTPERTIRGYVQTLQELTPPHGRVLPATIPLDRLRLVLPYRVWCSQLWQILLTIQNAIQNSRRPQSQ